MADVQIACDREQPRCESRIRIETVCVLHEAQPGLFEQILGNIAVSDQPRQKPEQPVIQRGVNLVERGGIAKAQQRDQIELRLAIHKNHNASAGRT